MKSFQFSLEKVLQFRLEQEKEWELKLGAAVGKCNGFEIQIEELHQKECSSLKQRDFENGADAYNWGLYRSGLTQHIQRLQKELAQARLEMEAVREHYLEASRKRKSLDKVKEKKQKEYHRYLNQEEYKAMDDMTAQKFAGEGQQ